MKDIKDNKIELLEEDLCCVHTYLDDLEIPRVDKDSKEYSIVGRIKILEARYLKQLSETETFNLKIDYIQKENMKNNIHILPSDRVTNLHIFENRFEYTKSLNSKSYQNLYITSDEKIKNGDWCYSIYGFVIRVDYISDGYIHHVGGGDNRTDCYKKIILTTDQNLFDDVQSIGDEFIKYFIENKDIKYVEYMLCDSKLYKLYYPKRNVKKGEYNYDKWKIKLV